MGPVTLYIRFEQIAGERPCHKTSEPDGATKGPHTSLHQHTSERQVNEPVEGGPETRNRERGE